MGNYSRRNLHYINMTEHAVQLWRVGLLPGEHVAFVKHDTISPSFDASPLNTNVVDRMLKLSFRGMVFYDKLVTQTSRCHLMLCLEQKSVEVVPSLIYKICCPRDMVFDPCFGTGATAWCAFWRRNIAIALTVKRKVPAFRT